MWKSILAIAFSLLCLVTVTAGMSDAKGRPGGARSSGGRGHARFTKPHRPNTVHQPKHVTTAVKPAPKHHHKHHKKHHHKHHDRQEPMGDFDGELDTPSADADDADEVEGAEEAEEAEAVLYGVEITALYKGTAAKEGIEIGDIILNFNGTPTPSFEALADAVARSGSQAQVLVIRSDGGERETVTLFPQDGRIGVSGEPVRVSE